MTVLAVIPDRFQKNALPSAIVRTTVARAGTAKSDVRRPTRGIQIKDDTYATMRVVLGDGTVIQLVNAGSRTGALDVDGKMRSDDYSNFLIQAVQEERIEKSQVVETFGEAFIFFYGERPRVLNIQGVLLNTFDFNWEAEWWWNYDNYLRGTQCVTNDARIYLSFDDTVVGGYIMSASSTKSAQEKNLVPFNFQLFVTDYINISRIGDPSADQEKTAPLSSIAETALFRPMLAPREGIAARMLALSQGSGLSGMPSLFEALATDAIRSVQTAWTRINQLVKNTISSVDAILGNPVRVPYGFEGSLVFDDPQVQLDTYPSGLIGKTLIKYSTFGENSDEFVDAKNHYASADPQLGWSMNSAFMGLNDFDNSQAMIKQAQAQWAANGFILPSKQLSAALALASQTGIGMQVIGASREVLRGGAQAVGAALGMAAPVVAGTTLLLGDAALADVATTGGLDRAAKENAPQTFDVLNGLKSLKI